MVMAAWSRLSMNSFNSFEAPQKFEPLSEYMFFGQPLLLVNLRIVLIKASVSAVSTTSRCIHLTVIQVKTTIHLFTRLRTSLVITGPHRSHPQCVNVGLSIAAHPNGKSTIFGSSILAHRTLQKKQSRRQVLIATLAESTHYFSLSNVSTCSRPM